MKRFTLLVGVLSIALTSFAQLKPYTLASRSSDNIKMVENATIQRLTDHGFEIVGNYTPADEVSRRVVVVTRPDLINIVSEKGGLTAFLSAFRVGITEEDDATIVSYTTPEYWANAYFRDDYPEFEEVITGISTDLSMALGSNPQDQFGSKSGIQPEKLRNYHYMMGMPRFDDTQVLYSYASFEEAVNVIGNNITSGLDSMELVYEIAIPGKNLKLYGFGFSGEDGEGEFMPIIDIGAPKHTAFLPYEFLVVDNEVHMLHGRYRIALSFPDLTMGTFMKIVSTPKVLKKRLEDVASPRVEQ